MDTLYKVLWKEHSEDGTSISYVSCDEIESSFNAIKRGNKNH